MKLFLRFQISGTTFLLWAIVFYYGQDAKNLSDLLKCIQDDFESFKILGLAAVAMPFGAIIHQFSTMIKPENLSRCCFKKISELPNEKNITKIKNGSDFNLKLFKYYKEKISRLNTYYYVRVDNAVLAPLFACIAVEYLSVGTIDPIWKWAALFIAGITLLYVPCIYQEIKEYKNKIAQIGETGEQTAENKWVKVASCIAIAAFVFVIALCWLIFN